MFEGITKFFKSLGKTEKDTTRSKDAAKERLHLVLMQDRANVSADFLDLMKQEIIEVIKKYIDIDEGAMDVRLTNKQNDDGTTGAPALYANIPIMTIKEEARKQAKIVEKEKNEEKVEKIKIEENVNKEEEIVDKSKEIEEQEKIIQSEQVRNEDSTDKNEKNDATDGIE